MKWNVFLCAALVAWMFLFAYGAPPIAVFSGTGLMAAWNYSRNRS
jgi:uncharacterized membrane protein